LVADFDESIHIVSEHVLMRILGLRSGK